MRLTARCTPRFLTALLCILHPCIVNAHAFGARYDLPLPLGFYLIGAALVVLITLCATLVMLRPGSLQRWSGHYDIVLPRLPWSWSRRVARRFLCALGVALFAMVLATALFGVDSPTRNFAPTFVWVIWWVGFAYVAQLVCNFWPYVNPWRWLGAAIDSLRHERTSTRLSHSVRSLDHWPAVVLFLAFAWVEIVSGIAERPVVLATLIVCYTGLTCVGVWLTGARHWLTHGEVFTVVFAVFGRFAPVAPKRNGFRLRIFGHGLLTDTYSSPALTAFVVLMLSTVTFDGFLETPAWTGILNWFASDQTVRPVLLALKRTGVNLSLLLTTIAYVVFPALFLCIYLFFCRLTSVMAGGHHRALCIAGAFVFSLVPIAIAYHFAHYFSFFLLAGQLIIPLLSDPFGAGWDLFGTAHRVIDISVINAKTTWYVAVFSIVLGHAIAVVLSHLTAIRFFDSRRSAVRSQIPMTVLMLGYTMVSLWILSQPIVESGKL